jgi:hypothetical protein
MDLVKEIESIPLSAWEYKQTHFPVPHDTFYAVTQDKDIVLDYTPIGIFPLYQLRAKIGNQIIWKTAFYHGMAKDLFDSIEQKLSQRK